MINWNIILFIITIFVCLAAIDIGLAGFGKNCFIKYKENHKILGTITYIIVGLCGLILLSNTLYTTLKSGIKNYPNN